MDHREKMIRLSDELQELSFNLADKLDTLNYHSGREAVRDLRDGAYSMTDRMMELIRDLGHNLVASGENETADGLLEMYSLLDGVRKCSLEPESYRIFLSGLKRLLELLDEWGDRGPVPGLTA